MAATIARARGIGRGKTAECSRLGHLAAEVEANTFHTFVTARTREDGSVVIDIERIDGTGRKRYLAQLRVSAESTPRAIVEITTSARVQTITRGME